jgi:hypothetical protein
VQVTQQRAMAEHRSLWLTRGAGRVKQDRQGLRIPWRAHWFGCYVGQLVETARSEVNLMHTLEWLGCIREQHPCSTVVDHVAQLASGRLGIDRHRDVTGPQGSEIGHDKIDAVRAANRDAMPRNEPVRRQPRSDRVNLTIEPGPGHYATYRLRLDQRDTGRLSLRLLRHKISKIGLQVSSVDKLDRCFRLAHPPESGTIGRAPDIMVMT